VDFSIGSKISLALIWSRRQNMIGRWSESMMSSTLTSENRTHLWTTMSRTSPLPSGTKWVGCCGAEISKLHLTNKSRSFNPEGFETLLFQTGCFAFRSPAKMDFALSFKSSVMSVMSAT
jgi:hypothetical protein